MWFAGAAGREEEERSGISRAVAWAEETKGAKAEAAACGGDRAEEAWGGAAGWIEGRWWLARDGSGRIPRWEASGWKAGGGDETDGTSLLKIRVGLVYL